MKTDELFYDLPEDLIAQEPCEPRDAARLLVIDRRAGTYREDVFENVAAYLHPRDCMVLNDTRVIRARLKGRKATGGAVEIFLLKERAQGEWEALVRPGSRVKPGSQVLIGNIEEVEILDRLDSGRRLVRFQHPDVLSTLEQQGEVPLPPYVHREQPDERDAERYQTIYARAHGAVAAPTAGLHFTDRVFRRLHDAGVRRTTLTLHVGYGTFKPIQAEDVADHVLEPESFELSQESAQALNTCRQEGGRVVAVGTTCTRVLETQYRHGAYQHGEGVTAHYIYPPYTFRGVDVLQTNFHLPRSSLLALVYAFGGVELMREAYAFAIRERFRFYSYGDVMLII
jgi:S-adenosylmethionine:tRNA ribosyltransferase-isomerase